MFVIKHNGSGEFVCYPSGKIREFENVSAARFFIDEELNGVESEEYFEERNGIEYDGFLIVEK